MSYGILLMWKVSYVALWKSAQCWQILWVTLLLLNKWYVCGKTDHIIHNTKVNALLWNYYPKGIYCYFNFFSSYGECSQSLDSDSGGYVSVVCISDHGSHLQQVLLVHRTDTFWCRYRLRTFQRVAAVAGLKKKLQTNCPTHIWPPHI